MANITQTSKRIVDLEEAAYTGNRVNVYGDSKSDSNSVDMSLYALLAGRPGDILHIDEIRKFTDNSAVTGLDIEGVNFLDNVVQIDPTLSSNPGYLDFVDNVDIRVNAVKVFTYDNPVAGVVRIGEGAGNDTMTQQDAILIGVNAGNALTSGLGSIFVGAHTGEFSTESFNVGIGHYALSSITDAVQTVAVGAYSFASTTNLYNNTGLGHYSGRWNTGQQNTFVGSYTGYGVDQSAGSPGSGNIGLGYNALLALESGDYNIAIGWGAASILETGNYNVIIGYAGSVTADQSYRLYLTPLIEGNYASGSEYLVSVYEFRVDYITENTADVGITSMVQIKIEGGIGDSDAILDSGGIKIDLQDEASGWARGFRFYDDTTALGFIGGYGSLQSISYLFMGKAFNDVGLKVYLDGETQLYYDNAWKLLTQDYGVRIIGDLNISNDIISHVNVAASLAVSGAFVNPHADSLIFYYSATYGGRIFTRAPGGSYIKTLFGAYNATEGAASINMMTDGKVGILTQTGASQFSVNGTFDTNDTVTFSGLSEDATETYVVAIDDSTGLLSKRTVASIGGELYWDETSAGVLFPVTAGVVVELDQAGGGYLDFVGLVDIRDDGVKMITFDTPAANLIRIGVGAGNDTQTGSNSIYIGANAGNDITSGGYNLFIGGDAGALIQGGAFNVALGYASLASNISGGSNTAIGAYSLNSILSSNNVGIGNNAGRYNEGVNNTFIGNYAGAGTSQAYTLSADNNIGISYYALRFLETGNYNIGIGYNSFGKIINTYYNVGIGYESGYYQLGGSNIYIGSESGRGNFDGVSSTASWNIGIGRSSLYSVETGQYNTGIGGFSFNRVKSGERNTGIGYASGRYQLGDWNVFIGANAGAGNTDGVTSDGDANVGIGRVALNKVEGQRNVAIGYYSLTNVTTGDGNTAVGYQAGINVVDGLYNINIGYNVSSSSGTNSELLIGRNTTYIIEGSTTGAAEWFGSAYEFRTDLITEYTGSNGVEFDVPILLTGLSAQSTETDVLYRNSSTGEITFGAEPVGMVYPGAGIALSTGSAWGTSITDNSSTWNNAYTHSQVTTGNPHQIDWSELQGTQPAPVSHNHTYSEITDFASGVSANETSHTNVVVDGDFVAEGIMLRGASSGVYSILANNSANWNTAYNHSQVSSGNPHSVTYAELGGSLPDHATSHESGGGDTINHDSLVGFLTTEHFVQSAISIPASQISDFDTEVSNNSDVASNTGARHVAVTILDTTTINFGLSAQQITGSAIYQMTVTADSSGLKLINDVNTPTAAQYYGSAPASTTKGWYDLPSGGTGYWEKNSTYVSLVTNTDWVAIGTDTPSMKLHVYGTASTDKIQTDIGLNFYQVPEPTGLSAALLSGTALGIGLYYYIVTYTTALGETRYNYTSITTTSGNQSVRLTLPLSSDYRVTGRKIYRTKVGDFLYQDYDLATIANNTQTTYDDTTPDSSLTGNIGKGYFRDNTTNEQIRVNGANAMQIGFNACIIGLNAGEDLDGGGRTVMIGTNSGRNVIGGYDNTFVGYSSGYYDTSGAINTAVGSYCLNDNETGHYNAAFGFSALANTVSGGSNTAVGALCMTGVTGVSTSYSTALGSNTARYLTGSYNTVLGYRAGLGVSGSSTGGYNILIGAYAHDIITTGSHNIIIGYNTNASSATANYEFKLGDVNEYILEGSLSATRWIGTSREFRVDLITEWTSSNGVEFDVPLVLSGLANTSQSYVLGYNLGTDLITYFATPSGGGEDGYLSAVTVNAIDDVDFTITGASNITGVDFGHDFTEHDNVTLTSLATDDIMKWSGTAWVNVPIPTGGGGGVYVTGTPADSYIAVWTNATTIEGTSSFLFDSGIKITSPTNPALDVLVSDTDTKIWRIGNSTGYGFYDLYNGTGSGDLNLLKKYSENQIGTDINYASITQSGVWSFHVTPKIGAIAELSSGLGTTMQHKLYFTGLTNVVTDYVLYYNTSGGLITWGAKPSGGGDDGVLSAVNASDITAVDFTVTGAADVLNVDFGHNISVHDDVDFTSLASTQIMQWNGSNWVNVAIPSGGGEDGYLSAVNASDIYNVDFTMVNTSDVLNVDFGHLLTKHDNVVITSLVSGQILEYNGSNWVNITTPSGGGGGTVTNVSAGNGMNFSDIISTGDVVLRTPTVNLSGTSTNAVNSSGHTHAITTVAVVNSGTGLADGNQIYDFVIGRGYTTNTGTVTQVNHGVGMNFSDFSTSGTITLGTPSVNLSATSSNSVSGTTHSHAINTAAVVNGGANFATGDQIYDFVIGRGYTTNVGTVTNVNYGAGMNFANFTVSGTITLRTPTVNLSGTSTNAVNSSGHTHAINTAAVVNGGSGLADGNQIYDFVIGLGYTGSIWTLNSYGIFYNESPNTVFAGTTPTTTWATSFVAGRNQSGYAAHIVNWSATVGEGLVVDAYAPSGTTYHIINARRAGSTVAKLNTNGKWTAVDFINSSDPRLKNVQGTVLNGLDLALRLNPIIFNWNTHKKNEHQSKEEQIGFLSTDVALVHQSLVTTDSDGYGSVSYAKISIINNAAIHQLNTKVETNADKIKRLEDKVKQLEDQLDGRT